MQQPRAAKVQRTASRPCCLQVGQNVRAVRKEDEIPLNPFTAGVYIATMMATVQVRQHPFFVWGGGEGGGEVDAST